jgi:hypothetical protein
LIHLKSSERINFEPEIWEVPDTILADVNLTFE